MVYHASRSYGNPGSLLHAPLTTVSFRPCLTIFLKLLSWVQGATMDKCLLAGSMKQ